MQRLRYMDVGVGFWNRVVGERLGVVETGVGSGVGGPTICEIWGFVHL